MAILDDHPTVQAVRRRPLPEVKPRWTRDALVDLAKDCGADDAGAVSMARSELDDQRDGILACFPGTKALLSIVCRMNREPIRSPARSVANNEFHQTTDRVNDVAREIVRRLEAAGVRAMNPPAGFPMEMAQFPGKVWVVSHKPVAVAAGLGQIGVHRNVIHPKFGNFILLGTILLDLDLDGDHRPIDYNPCLGCKLCVAACPVGAIKPDGRFDFSACMNHNYREFMSGYTDYAEQIADSKSAFELRRRISDAEQASMWQSLSFGANYKAAYCLAVCPAGEDVIAPFLGDRAKHVQDTLKPLQQKAEPVYVVPGSDAEEHVARRYPHKTVRRIGGVRPTSIAGFFSGMPLVFQAGQSKGLNAVYHFDIHGSETGQATVTIREETIDVKPGLIGAATCTIRADAATWLGFLRKERNIVWAIVRGKVKVRGGIKWLKAFGKCFPS